MIRPMRVAVIGLGNVAEAHLDAYRTLREKIELVAFVEPRHERLRSLSTLYGVAGFTSTEQMINEVKPDIACVLTPTSTHRSMTEQCASAGVHVLCEKPMAVELEDARAMDAACVAGKVKFFYGSSYRYLPTLLEAKRIIARGEIGRVRLIFEQIIGGAGTAAYRPLSDIHFPKGGPGGGSLGLVDHGIHMLDIFPWLCDTSVVSVFGRGDWSGQAAAPEFAFMQMGSGAVGMLAYDNSTFPAELPTEGVFSAARQWIDGRGWMGETGAWESPPDSIRIHGSDGSIRIFHYANKLFINNGAGTREIEVSSGTTPWHFAAQLDQFCHNVRQDEPPTVSAVDGIKALHVLRKIYESGGNSNIPCI